VAAWCSGRPSVLIRSFRQGLAPEVPSSTVLPRIAESSETMSATVGSARRRRRVFCHSRGRERASSLFRVGVGGAVAGGGDGGGDSVSEGGFQPKA
jgi:hypothetical protein